MKIEREVIAQLLSQAEEAPTKTYMLHGLEVIALCRTWLAVADAPEGKVDMACASDAVVVEELDNPAALVKRRVRLLEWTP